MKFNKLLLICLLLFAIVSFGAVSAADDVNSTEDLTTQETEDVGDDLEISDICEKTVENSQSSEDMLKEESKTIVITNKTFTDYFDGEGRLFDSVPEGSVLDFQGLFEVSDNIKGIYIGKSVNITSSTKNAVFMFNSTNGELGKENLTGRFIVDGVSTINIENVLFNRTQVLIYDSSNVILNNIKMTSYKYNIYENSIHGVTESNDEGILRICNVNNISIKNSYFYAYKIISGVIECSDIGDIIIDNNTFHSYSDRYGTANSVGRKINLKTIANTVKMTNNVAYANCSWAAFAFLQGKEILFENNSCTYWGSALISQAADGMWVQLGQKDLPANISAKHNKNIIDLRVCGNAVLMDNEMHSLSISGSYSNLIYNCTLNGISVDSSNVLFKNSKVGSISIEKNNNNITFENNTMGPLTIVSPAVIRNNSINGKITVKSMETFIDRNSINGDITIEDNGACEITKNNIAGTITISSKLSYIAENTITAPQSDYSVYIKSGKDYINNEVSDNEIYSKWYCGDNAVSYDENYLNYIEYNTPANQIDMSVDNTVDVFDYGGNTTININVPNVKGNVTIDVNGEKYTVNLVNGEASHVLTKYSLGFNYVTVIYYDVFEDVWAIGHANFTVNKVAHCPVELVYGELSESEPSNINFILPEDTNGNIYVSLTNDVYSVDIEQTAKGGNNIVTLPGLPEGEYTIVATFTSIKYVTNSSSGKIRFVHYPVYQLTAADVVMDYKDGSKYKVLVTEDGNAVAGGTVKITFNGKTTNVKTDKNGYVTLSLDGAPKTYTIKATYNGITKLSKVTIKNVLKAKNISKKKAKIVKFQATLKTSKGKAIAGKKITFKLKGKNYSAKTNKKGVATVSLKNLKAGKYTITSKYGACTVKSTLTIKK